MQRRAIYIVGNGLAIFVRAAVALTFGHGQSTSGLGAGRTRAGIGRCYREGLCPPPDGICSAIGRNMGMGFNGVTNMPHWQGTFAVALNTGNHRVRFVPRYRDSLNTAYDDLSENQLVGWTHEAGPAHREPCLWCPPPTASRRRCARPPWSGRSSDHGSRLPGWSCSPGPEPPGRRVCRPPASPADPPCA